MTNFYYHINLYGMYISMHMHWLVDNKTTYQPHVLNISQIFYNTFFLQGGDN